MLIFFHFLVFSRNCASCHHSASKNKSPLYSNCPTNTKKWRRHKMVCTRFPVSASAYCKGTLIPFAMMLRGNWLRGEGWETTVRDYKNFHHSNCTSVRTEEQHITSGAQKLWVEKTVSLRRRQCLKSEKPEWIWVLHDSLVTLYDNPPFSVFDGLSTRLIYHIICPKHLISQDKSNSSHMYNFHSRE